MKNYSVKMQSKILKRLILLCDTSPNGVLFKPVRFVENFPFVSQNVLMNIIEILEEKNLVDISWADYPESLNIYRLAITPQGYDFHPQAEYINTQRWKDRIWGFVSGSLFSAAISIIIALNS